MERRWKLCVAGILIVMLIIGCVSMAGMRSVYASEKAGSKESTEETTIKKNKRKLSNPTFDQGEVVYDCVWFGRYPQSDATGRKYESIKWRVLSVSGDDIFLISDKSLDCQPFTKVLYQKTDEDEYEEVTWKYCTLRTWLNGTFMNNAFSRTERAAIKTKVIKTELDPGSDKYSSKNFEYKTSDKVYLLSEADVDNAAYGLYIVGNNLGQSTAYAKSNGAKSYDGSSYWWLRSPSSRVDSKVMQGTSVSWYYDNAGFAACTTVAVTPVMHIKKSSKAWTYAGIVGSDGTVLEINKPKSIVKSGWIRTKGIYKYMNKAGKRISKPAGWYVIRDKYCYLNAAGRRISKKSGWYKLNNKYYYINSKGYREKKESGWYTINGKYCYILKSGRRLAKSKGWYKIADKYVYISSAGKRLKKSAGWYKINNKYYYIESTGERQEKGEGWYRIGSKKYYIKSNGKRVKKKSGWYGDGYICSDGTIYKGWKTIRGKKYYFSKDGCLKGDYVYAYYSDKYKRVITIRQFKYGKSTWYQSVVDGAKKDTSSKLFGAARKKYPNNTIFDGIGDPTMSQCDIFSYAVATDRGDSYPRSTWEQVTDINSIQPGDIIKYDNRVGGVHFITVTFVLGNFFQFVDANGTGVKNSVLWDQWGTKTEYKEVFILYFKRP